MKEMRRTVVKWVKNCSLEVGESLFETVLLATLPDHNRHTTEQQHREQQEWRGSLEVGEWRG